MAVQAVEGWKQGGDRIDIPRPSGRHAVGCVDLMHKFPGEEDGHLVRLFYPSEGGAGFEYSRCFRDEAYIKAHDYICTHDDPLFPRLRDLASLNKEPEPDPLCPALTEAPLLAGANTFPVIVFSHGLSGMSTDYTAIYTDLASNGYVVAAVEHRDESARVSLRRVPKPGGASGERQDAWLEFKFEEFEHPSLRHKQVVQRALECGKSLDLLELLNDGTDVQNMMDVKFDFGQFRGRIDLSTAAVMGHSFGGATTVQALIAEPRFKCGIALDAWMFPISEGDLKTGVSQPLLFINSQLKFQWRRNVQMMLQLVSNKKPDERGISQCQILTLKNANHGNQTDFYFIWKRFYHEYSGMSEVDPTECHRANMDLCYSFLKRFLLNDPASQGPISNLDGGPGRSEHVITVDIKDIKVELPKRKDSDIIAEMRERLESGQ